MRQTNGSTIIIAAFAALILMAQAEASVNKSIKIAPGNNVGSQSSVNGSITVGAGAVIDGSLETVNGSIRVDENVTLGDAETVNGAIGIGPGSSVGDINSVNGAIKVAENVTVDGEIDVVNGRIVLDSGTKVTDGVSNVNGEIELDAAEVGGNLTTVNGDVSLNGGSILRGDLVVEKPHGMFNTSRKPRVVIGPNSRVHGRIVLEREVELFISDTAEVGGVSGKMSLDDAVRFSGDRP